MDILLVEDNAADAELTLRTLKQQLQPHNIVVATDGAQALGLIFEPGGQVVIWTPHLVLLDLKLPKVSGHEVLRKLKSNDETKAIPVVILTSSEQERDILESYNSGANSYMVKPIDCDQFSRVVTGMGHYWLVLNKFAS